jgi:hypothetical protein
LTGVLVRLTVSLVVIASLGGGCDGENKSGTPTGGGTVSTLPVLSAEEWASRADGICSAANRASTAVANPSTVAEFVVFDEQLLGIVRDAENQLRQLGPPPGEEDAFADLLAAYEKTASGFEQMGVLARKLDQSADLNSLSLSEQSELEGSFGAISDSNYLAAATALGLGSRKCWASAITTVDMTESHHSGQSGKAELTPVDDHHMHVVITLDNAPSAAESAIVYVGTCDSLIVGIEEYELEDVVEGRSEGDLAASLPDLSAQRHHFSIVVRDEATVVACGELPVP